MTQTYTDLRAYLRTHRRALLWTDGLQVPVTVLDVRQTFGALHALVTPVGGHGQRWVSAERLEPSPQPVAAGDDGSTP